MCREYTVDSRDRKSAFSRATGVGTVGVAAWAEVVESAGFSRGRAEARRNAGAAESLAGTGLLADTASVFWGAPPHPNRYRSGTPLMLRLPCSNPLPRRDHRCSEKVPGVHPDCLSASLNKAMPAHDQPAALVGWKGTNNQFIKSSGDLFQRRTPRLLQFSAPPRAPCGA